MKIKRLKQVSLASKGLKGLTILVLILHDFYFNICGKLAVIRCYTQFFSMAENRLSSNPADINRFNATEKLF